jgi:hypothetical protein
MNQRELLPAHCRVKFRGKAYWYNESAANLGAKLSPLSHFDADGNFQEGNAIADGLLYYAVIKDGEIKRFGKVIGNAIADGLLCYAVIKDGEIKRFGKVIGSVCELERL